MLIKRSFSLAGHRTSIALEAEFWAALTNSAARKTMPLARLVAMIDADRGTPLASALRVYVLRDLQGEAKEDSSFSEEKEAKRLL